MGRHLASLFASIAFCALCVAPCVASPQQNQYVLPTAQQPAATSSNSSRPNFEEFQPFDDPASLQTPPTPVHVEAKPLPLNRDRSAANDGTQSGQDTRPTGVGSFWTTTFALLFVVTLILGMSKLLSKRTGLVGATGLPPEAIEILGRRYLNQKQAIHLIRCGSRILVVGASPNGLQTLAEFTDVVEVDYLAGVCKKPDSENSMVQNFRRLLSKSQDQRVDDVASEINETASQMEREFNRRNSQSFREGMLNSSQQIGNS